MRALIQLRPSADLIAAVADPSVSVAASDVAGELPGFDLDHSYAPLSIPEASTAQGVVAADTVVVRGEIADAELDATVAQLTRSGSVTGVFADPRIETTLTCGGDPAVGTAADVANLLHAGDLASAGMDGRAVALAIVDTGINVARVQQVRGGQVTIDAKRSWNPPRVSGAPGQFPVAHGSMCAFDVLLGAPQATLLDIPVLQSKTQGGSQMDGLLSDALAAYAHLRTVLTDQPEATRALVVSNSWGAFSPDWDFPVGQPGNYSDNPSHPFNLIVGSLEAAGADILFAAGNCGRDCPDSRCAYKDHPIGGANSHPSVLSIGGVDTKGQRVGYSSQGPGRLADRKPDICSYTHFLGSKVFGANDPDSGTSAACPVAAGLVAAIRTVYPASKVSPAQLRGVLQRTATAQPGGYNYDYGYGVVDAAAVLAELKNTEVRA
ncbi:S8 family serine peptidase [Nocardia spumae]|uniref:S8 family serine peptidase n=1 Tax=Nocardia spumae TaxID=2887190 RepID=UPI001D145E2F|nr:S8 family serine peptidase [Nocardia spumae]